MLSAKCLFTAIIVCCIIILPSTSRKKVHRHKNLVHLNSHKSKKMNTTPARSEETSYETSDTRIRKNYDNVDKKRQQHTSRQSQMNYDKSTLENNTVIEYYYVQRMIV